MVHLYFPAIRFGFSQRDAGLWAFFVSAVFHEVELSASHLFFPSSGVLEHELGLLFGGS